MAGIVWVVGVPVAFGERYLCAYLIEGANDHKFLTCIIWLTNKGELADNRMVTGGTNSLWTKETSKRSGKGSVVVNMQSVITRSLKLAKMA